MKTDDIKVGGLYTAKVSDRVVKVRIDSVHSGGGWNATNTATGKRIRIKSAQRLRGAADEATGVTSNARAESQKAEERPKRISALNAAAQVLAKAAKPMRAQELIAAMAEQNLWKSPSGKTPHATLYAAMMREERRKGSDSRFRLVDRGMFALIA